MIIISSGRGIRYYNQVDFLLMLGTPIYTPPYFLSPLEVRLNSCLWFVVCLYTGGEEKNLVKKNKNRFFSIKIDFLLFLKETTFTLIFR